MQLTISLPHGPHRLGITGPAERNLKIIRETMSVSIAARDDALKLTGDTEAIGRAAYVIEQLVESAERSRPMDRQQLLDCIASAGHLSHAERYATGNTQEVNQEEQKPSKPVQPPSTRGISVYLPDRHVKALTDGQRDYIDAIFSNDLTICTGPAGTGKTYLAVAAAVSLLKRGDVRKIVLVRPAVEAGEKLGFLPGSMQEKVNPYVRPLLDALHDMMEFDQIQRFMACDLVEIVPLAFMRGRTLNDALIILDEAQNTTKSQMLMFLTRLGHGSKMVVTGDTSQVDLEKPRDSGLIDAIRRLQRMRGVATVTLAQQDIVRHNLVQRIVDAYGESDAQKNAQTPDFSGLTDEPKPKPKVADNQSVDANR